MFNQSASPPPGGPARSWGLEWTPQRRYLFRLNVAPSPCLGSWLEVITRELGQEFPQAHPLQR